MDTTVVTHDDLTKQGVFGLSNHYCFFQIDFVKSRILHLFPQSGGFRDRNGLARSAARLEMDRHALSNIYRALQRSQRADAVR
jgi:hypothetical protein